MVFSVFLFRSELSGSGGHPMNKTELPGNAIHNSAGPQDASEVEGSPAVIMELVGSPIGDGYFRNQDSISATASNPISPVINPGDHGHGAASHDPVSPPIDIDITPNSGHFSAAEGDLSSTQAAKTPINPQNVQNLQAKPI